MEFEGQAVPLERRFRAYLAVSGQSQVDWLKGKGLMVRRQNLMKAVKGEWVGKQAARLVALVEADMKEAGGEESEG